MDLSDEGLRAKAEEIRFCTYQLKHWEEIAQLIDANLRSVRDEARRQALEEAATVADSARNGMVFVATQVDDWPTDVPVAVAIHALKSTGAATTPARPAAAPASSPEPTDPAGRAS